jgi:O-antigen/teichoic acid export membrane protein
VTIRECVVQANQTLVPTISQLHERNRTKIPAIYRESYRLVFFLAVPAMSLVAMFSPLISRLWLGRYEVVFAQFVSLLAAGWLINILCNPAYVVDLGTGSLRWVSVGVTVTAILNFALGAAAGILFGPVSIVASGVLALIAGYVIILIAYHREHNESFGMLIPRESRKLLAVSAVAGIIALLFLIHQTSPFPGSLSLLAILSTAFATAIVILIWRHPIRIRLFHWLANGIAA